KIGSYGSTRSASAEARSLKHCSCLPASRPPSFRSGRGRKRMVRAEGLQGCRECLREDPVCHARFDDSESAGNFLPPSQQTLACRELLLSADLHRIQE